MKLSRRKLATAMVGSAVAALAQTQPAAVPTADEDLAAAKNRIKSNSEALAKQVVPMDTEPALQFKA